jgi:hypothetical protein
MLLGVSFVATHASGAEDLGDFMQSENRRPLCPPGSLRAIQLSVRKMKGSTINLPQGRATQLLSGCGSALLTGVETHTPASVGSLLESQPLMPADMTRTLL